jgi:WD40 repeat protein
LRGHQGFVTQIALSPDERRLVSASADNTLRLWDLASGESRILRGHTGPVSDVAFSADGQQIVSTSADGTVRLWPDDLPDDPGALRAWIEAATSDR